MIVVTGMHRSGTSLVAMTLEALGVSFGDHARFYAADEWNERGYFERRDVMDINNRMITGFARTGSKLSALAGQIRYLAEPDVDSVVARGSRFADDIRMVTDEIGDGAIKDPRLCITWSAWSDHVDIEACVLCLRHPHEVADSLQRRQRIPMALGLRFWRYHMDALRRRTPANLIVVDLDSLTSRPEVELQALVTQLGLGLDSGEALRRFEAVYEPELTRSRPPEDRPALTGETRDLWVWLAGHRATAGTESPE